MKELPLLLSLFPKCLLLMKRHYHTINQGKKIEHFRPEKIFHKFLGCNKLFSSRRDFLIVQQMIYLIILGHLASLLRANLLENSSLAFVVQIHILDAYMVCCPRMFG